MKPTKYQQTLDFLYSQLPMFQRIGSAAFKKDLDNTLALCRALGNPETTFPSIHVAGTNGKGTTVHLLAAALQAQGYRVGVYTSPHYRDFRERIKINGVLMSPTFVIEFVEAHTELLQKIQPSFFEITVAMAFAYFAQEKVDIAVIETGLGGRLDSTNVIAPLLSVITNISFDHQDLLGDTLPLIAAEKAGIIKAATPVVIGQDAAETSPVFLQKAREVAAPIHFAETRWTVELLHTDHFKSVYQVDRAGQVWLADLEVELAGPFQAENLATALETLEILPTVWPGFKLDTTALRHGWSQLKQSTHYKGRWQVLPGSPLTLADSAHNPAGLELVFKALAQLEYQQLHIVVGMVADKDVGKALALFPADAAYYFARPAIPRGLDAGKLQAAAAQRGLKGKVYSSVRRALAAARRRAQPQDLIFVGGSTFVVAEVVP